VEADMKSRGKPAGDTRQRLLDEASKAFAEKGFRDTTVAEICRRARANIAAVNYHFGSKKVLYREAWLHAHRRTLEAFPPDGGVSADAPAEQRLKGRIRSMLQRTLSEDGLEFRIMDHELATPTGLLGQVFQDTVRPLAEAMENIVGDLLGGHGDERSVQLCAVCIIGPCMQVMRRVRLQKSQGQLPWFSADMIEGMVRHFSTFALAGIREIRRQMERDDRK
jgi:TetR/AcrR family transcriptional regulator, regulator of cefoperazone and chloramphenicol sensitivity